MSETKPKPGSIAWHDLTVPDADKVRDFYRDVAGWESQGVDMGGYEDYQMVRPDGEPAGGVCWARGANAGLPAQWLIYIVVTDLDASLEAVRAHGGEVVAGPKSMGEARYAVVRDPAGAAAALWQPG